MITNNCNDETTHTEPEHVLNENVTPQDTHPTPAELKAVIKQFCDDLYADIEDFKCDSDNINALALGATLTGNVNLLHALLHFTLEITSMQDPQNIVQHAALCDDLPIMKLLVEHGYDINAHDRYYVEPILWAAIYGSERLLQFMLEHGAHPDSVCYTGYTPLGILSKYSALQKFYDTW